MNSADETTSWPATRALERALKVDCFQRIITRHGNFDSSELFLAVDVSCGGDALPLIEWTFDIESMYRDAIRAAHGR